MVRASMKNPYAVVAISLIVVLLGVVSYQKMVVDIFPEIKVPVVAVATFYKGMGPSEIEGAITLRLEVIRGRGRHLMMFPHHPEPALMLGFQTLESLQADDPGEV
jgi:hypothetical protein